MKEKNNKLGLIILVLCLLLLPGLEVLFIIGYNSNYLIRTPFLILIGVLIILITCLLILGLKTFTKIKVKKFLRNIFYGFMVLYVLGCVVFTILLYGSNDKFRTWLITTAMQTMNHQYLCKWFYSDEQIDEIMNSNFVKESGESTDTSLVNNEVVETYIDEYDKEILDVEEGTKYKIIELEVDGQKAYLAAIYDPSKIKLRVTESLGTKGEYVTTMAQKSNAILAINGGGFYDPGACSWGGTPGGITIMDGKIVTDELSGINSGGIIGFNNDNILVLLKNKTAQEAVNMGVRDAVTWGPFLIVNGVPSEVSGNGGWGLGARTAIGQRADGIVLFLVVDSNSSRTRGASMVDLRDIMLRYHAINASNLDGGTSSVMVLPRDVAINEYGATCHDYYTKYACAINDPIDSTGTHQTRFVADAWVVLE